MALKKLLFRLLPTLFFFALLIVFLILNNVRYNFSLTGYKAFRFLSYKEATFPRLSTDEIVNLGWAHHLKESTLGYNHQNPKSSYINFSLEKPDSIYRVGFFGCSYTMGSESRPDYDYVSQLGRLFRDAGVNSIEVINFGVGSYGMHQSYLLWSYLAKKYELDCVVFNPFSWHHERDHSFVFANYYGPVHARYILSRDTIELIEIEAESRKEAVKNYRSQFFQDWKYVKYDYRVPNLLKPYKWTDENPFYYLNKKMSGEEEAEQIYLNMYPNVPGQGFKTVILVNDTFYLKLGKKEEMEGVNFWNFLPSTGPDNADDITVYPLPIYRAPLAHYSPSANYLRAKKLYWHFTGHQPLVEAIRFVKANKLTKTPFGFRYDLQPLNFTDSLGFTMGDATFNHFFTDNEDAPMGSYNESVEVKEKAASALFLFSDPLQDWQFLPLQDFPVNGAEVILIIVQSGKEYEFDLGNLIAINPYIYKWEKNHQGNENLKVDFSVNSPAMLKIQGNVDMEDVYLQIENQRFPLRSLNLNLNDQSMRNEAEYSLAPTHGQILTVRSAPSEIVYADSMDSRGTVYFDVWFEGNLLSFPFCGWELDKIDLSTYQWGIFSKNLSLNPSKEKLPNE